MAENVNHNMHNLYTPRGALVRGAKAWAQYLDEAIDLFARKTDVLSSRSGAPNARSPDKQERQART